MVSYFWVVIGTTFSITGIVTWGFFVYEIQPQMIRAELQPEPPKEKQIICWQGIPYQSYFGRDIELWMIDDIPELNGLQIMILNKTGVC